MKIIRNILICGCVLILSVCGKPETEPEDEFPRILKVNGIIPSDENVRNNRYAFIAPYNAVIRSTDAEEVGGKFLNWMLAAMRATVRT
jgi:hypothetical protein